MSATYKAVSWTPDKKTYDRILALGVALYLGVFLGFGFALHPETTAETQVIRALGTGSLLLLHIVLSIGPLARLDRRFLPLLYNRRHLGVVTFLLGAGHGLFALVQFHGLGVRNPLVSVLTSNGGYDSVAQFPFQPLGLLALFILFLMAATSHDFWLANLTAPTWKALHMSVYVAYVALVAHVALGALQSERHPGLAAALVVGVVAVTGLHLAAAFADPVNKTVSTAPANDDWVRLGPVTDIPLERARMVEVGGERVAVFRYTKEEDVLVSAVSSVCQHQNGPLGEGKVIDGCITCPWHGFQYRPEDGASPPPFTEKIPTFAVEIRDGEVWLDPQPRPAGTHIEPARVGPAEPARAAAEAGP